MSDLPSGWTKSTLGEIGEYLNGRGFKKSEWCEAGRPIIRIQNLTGTSNQFNHFAGQPEERYLANPGDILVSWSATLGVFVWNGPEAVVNQHIFKVRSFINPLFHRYLLLSVLDELRRQTHGSGMVHITKSRFENTSVLVPSLAEQERIVAAIEEQCSRLDAAAAALERVRRNLKRMCTAVLQAAITGKLSAQGAGVIRTFSSADNPLSGHLSAANARKIERVTRDLLRLTWDTPQSWIWKAASEVCEVVASGSTPPQEAMAAGDGDVPYIKVYNLTRSGDLDFSVRPTFIDRATHEGPLRRSCLYPGDVLTNIVGPPLGKVAVVPSQYPEWNTNQAVVVFRPVPSLHPRLLKYWLMSPPILRLLKSTSRATAGQFNVSLTTCRALPLPIPPRAQQDVLVAAIEGYLSLIDTQELVVERAFAHSEVLRSSILASAFSGSLVAQDAKDESASVLMERIADQRVSHNGHKPGRTRQRSRKLTA